jgi:acyl-CoA hydrolase
MATDSTQATEKFAKESRATKISIVLPPDTNHHGTMFGGKLMAQIDDVATISATRHARRPVVTASTDSVDFIQPVKLGDSVCLQSFVTWAGKTSMEVFVKVIAENLLTGERKICTTAFLTFVALDENGKPTPVPKVVPESTLEIQLNETAADRMEGRKNRRHDQAQLIEVMDTRMSWQ